MRNLMAIVVVAACAHAPATVAEKSQLDTQSLATLQEMRQKDPGLNDLLNNSAGYVVLPNVSKGGFIAGVAWGRGVLYQHGVPIGYVTLDQGSIGAQAGGQTIAELIVLRDQYGIDRLKAGHFSLGANANAELISAGAAAATRFDDGVAVFQLPKGGLMAELSVSGQQLKFQGT